MHQYDHSPVPSLQLLYVADVQEVAGHVSDGHDGVKQQELNGVRTAGL